MSPLRALALGLLSMLACRQEPARSALFEAPEPLRFDPSARPTCLVLSVGGPDGVAHLGAIAAVKAAGLRVAGVVGNSMGSLVGALYAAAPAGDTTLRWRQLLTAYRRATGDDKLESGLATALALGAMAGVVSDGEPAATLGAAAGGFLLGQASAGDLDRRRLTRVLRETLAGMRLEDMPIPFVTFHHEPRGHSLELVHVRRGDLAEAVGDSIANPLLFDDVVVGLNQPLDPGADRAAAVPIEDACRLFPAANILAVNVTGRAPLFSAEMTCPLREVRLPPFGLTARDLLETSPRMQQAVAAARRATEQTLARR